MIQVLEDRAIGAGTVTRDGLREMLAEEIGRFGGSLQNQQQNQEMESNDPVGELYRRRFHWGGEDHYLPDSYKLPSGTLLAASRAWMIPDTQEDLPALRRCGPDDFVGIFCSKVEPARKRFSDLSVLMRKIFDNELETPTLEQLNAMVHRWELNCGIPTRTPKGRARRIGQLNWSTVLSLLE